MKKEITKREKDYNQWYQDVIDNAELAENSIVRGCMVIKPHGYAIWENIQKEMDRRIKETGHKNLYFPLFVPKSTLAKEAEHVAGFAKESAVVTHHRLISTENGLEVDPNSKLEEEVIIRPTSEAVMYETFSKWIESWRDLPLLVNQWANIVRWEMRTKLFLRTTEFLWQEGHTVHATYDEAEIETLKMLNVYKDFVEEFLAMSPIIGRKSESEKFPGAEKTYTVEALMQDGKALQSGTSHNLSDNFAKPFDIKFADEKGELSYAYQTSWGMSTRIIGGLIMTHGDDKGIILPPKITPIQVVIVPIWKANTKTEVYEYANALSESLKEKGVLVELDARDYQTAGYKFNEWEKKGIPIRIEIGANEVKDKTATLVNRLDGEKSSTALADIYNAIEKMLAQIQIDLKFRADNFRLENTRDANSYDEFKEIISEKRGFINAFWCENEACETSIKEETKATTRCLPLDIKEEKGKCVYCGKDAKHRWIFAQAY